MSDENLEKQRQLKEQYENKINALQKQCLENASPEQKKMIDELLKYRWNRTDLKVYKRLYNTLKDGTYAKPSDFIENELGCIFGTLVPMRFKPHLYYAVDYCIKWIYSQSYWRRSFHYPDYLHHLNYIIDILYQFIHDINIDKDMTDIFKHRFTEEETAYYNSSCYISEMVAYELDNGNTEFQTMIEDILFGESKETISVTIIRGILQSENAAVHELLGKLLLAARLQEGLRQSICENADYGTVSGFKSIIQVIADNNLIRFSAVKRAVGTWLGLISYETSDLERISQKYIDLITDCINSENTRESYLSSEDSTQIYTALWAYGVYDLENAINRTIQLVENGSHHQVLTAGYFLANIENNALRHQIAKSAIKKYSTDYDIMALYLPYFITEWYSHEQVKNHYHYRYDTWDKVFDSLEETKDYYHILRNAYQQVKKTSMVFSPCIFPWYSAELKKSDIAKKICIIAGLAQDDTMIDDACDTLKNIVKEDYYSDYKSNCLEIMLQHAKTPKQLSTLTLALGDKNSSVRDSAFTIITSNQVTLTDENYIQIEDMLRYKNEDIRNTLIELLCKRDDEHLKCSVERLLSDKKEEKRTAGLDIVMRIEKTEQRRSLYNTCKTIVAHIENPTTKEQILIDNILQNTADVNQNILDTLFSENDIYQPVLVENDYIKNCLELFTKYYPDSNITGNNTAPDRSQTHITAVNDIISLDKFIIEHENDEFVGYSGETHTVSGANWQFQIPPDENNNTVPLINTWNEWYISNGLTPDRLLRMKTVLHSYDIKNNSVSKNLDSDIDYLFGIGFSRSNDFGIKYFAHISKIVNGLLNKYLENQKQQLLMLSVAVTYWYVKNVPDEKVFFLVNINEHSYSMKYTHYIGHPQLSTLAQYITDYLSDEHSATIFPLLVAANQKTFIKSNASKKVSYYELDRVFVRNYSLKDGFYRIDLSQYLLAAYQKIVTIPQLYKFIFDKTKIDDALSDLSNIVRFIKEREKLVSQNRAVSWRQREGASIIARLLGKTENFSDNDLQFFDFVLDIYQTVMNVILPVELRRGDSETKFSKHITNIHRIYGIHNLVAILSALGGTTLDRSGYYYGNTKKQCLSHLLSVCVPEVGDTAEKLRSLIEKTDITEQRLIETALYSPEWLEIIADYLGWEGFIPTCYYFMAHMNESFDDKRKAIIARYTPLTPQQLNNGAFDINWFKDAYHTIGEKRFRQIYDAAKYISDGAKHTRARKYADAALGILKADEVKETIADKRNKDLVMAYSLIPLDGDNDMVTRYVFLQKFLKESKKFGSQRMASEKTAVEISMENLAMNAGYADVTRLTLRMETKLLENNRHFFEKHDIEDITVWLSVDDSGKVSAFCEKKGKALKSIPAKFKKNDYILSMNDFKKQLTDQFRRTKAMLENAMEEQTPFTFEEINSMRTNPVLAPIVNALIFKHDLDINFISDFTLNDSDLLTVAHPYQLYQSGQWITYQKILFDRQITQPFKQVFRELYVKTDEEQEMLYSLRYAGNQIQPSKTVACLKGRRWIADIEDGLQKIYYKENIIASIYAAADWFSPSDIEAPTLEYVVFYDRKTGKRMKISDIPDILFSEVMRDVDLAISVAHAGNVDPETSHSTIEMRAALVELTMPMFKLDNVKVQGTHAHIDGQFGSYTVHLGSGVIHKKGGSMISVLPVHSQHRGKLFLPFADDDPKTAEIITKILFFAQDSKIKDPSILSQIK